MYKNKKEGRNTWHTSYVGTTGKHMKQVGMCVPANVHREEGQTDNHEVDRSSVCVEQLCSYVVLQLAFFSDPIDSLAKAAS